ncbi:MAG: helix-turn-helix transcriptional regulator [Clostridia bacterium]|nr:helix-turn-helix transcriptional regulator [Clostridia bacterium]
MRNELVKPTLPNSSVHVSGTARKAKADGICDLHMHSEFEILKIYEGHTEFYVNDKEYRVERDDIIFVNSRVPHYTVIHKDSRAFFVQFDVNINSEPGDGRVYMSKYLSRFINQGNTEAVVFKAGSEINQKLSDCLDKILDENISRQTSYDIFIKSYIYNIIGILYRENIIKSPEASLDTQIIKIMPALEYIDTHYSEQLTLQELSKLMNINEYYFCRLFKKMVNTPFVQYLNFVRVCKAEKMLLSTDKSISEISYETGFSSISYFNRIFKKYKFCTPSTYRKIKYEPGQ